MIFVFHEFVIDMVTIVRIHLAWISVFVLQRMQVSALGSFL